MGLFIGCFVVVLLVFFFFFFFFFFHAVFVVFVVAKSIDMILGAKCRIGCLWEDFSKIALELYYAKISTRVICSFILSQNRS